MNTSKDSFLGRSRISFIRLAVIASLTGAFAACVAPRRGSDLADVKHTTPGEITTEAQRVLVDASGSRFGVELAEGPGSNTLVLSFPNGELPDYTSERLDNPPRLVIDLKNVSIPANRTFDTQDAGVIERIRLGSHSEKTRIVLDLPAGETLDYKVERARSLETGSETLNVIVNTDAVGLASTEAAVTEDLKFSESTLKTAEKPVLAKDLTIDKPAEPTPADIALGSLMTEKPAAVKAEAALPEPSLVQKVELKSVTATENILRIEGTRLAKAQLEKTAPSEYVLKIPDGQLAEAADTTLIATANAGAIRSVRPVMKGKDVWLRIFSLPNVGLDLARTKNSVTVAAQSVSGSHNTARAQVDLEKLNVKDSGDSEISALLGDQPKYTGRLISLDLQDTDIDNALRIIAEVSNLNIIASDDVQGKITLRLIDVPWDQALDVILKTNGLDKVQEGNVVRIAPVEKLRTERESLKQARQAEEELEPLQVRYVRISYAKAAELKTLVDSVLSERGSAAYDERTNQLIIKDIRKGIVNVADLIAKLDLRTPQVLLETQIVEASRTLLRDLGSEFGFTMVQSPATGNATGYNFPNSISLGGSATPGIPGSTTASSFPAAGGSAVSLLLDSADATRSIAARLSALESEGRAKIISRPAVATTNNKQAIIKSVEKIRIKIPEGGLSVATGSGAQASGSAGVATETIEIGIVLEVTPQASPDYYVLLDINAKSSTLGGTLVDGIPSEIERSATSSVLVSSGQTFAMGGIYKITDNENLEGVPFLKDIPVFGHLFRRSLINNRDEELLFFITPRVIEGSFDDAAMKL